MRRESRKRRLWGGGLRQFPSPIPLPEGEGTAFHAIPSPFHTPRSRPRVPASGRCRPTPGANPAAANSSTRRPTKGRSRPRCGMFEIDRQAIARMRGAAGEKIVDRRLVELNRQEAVLETVVVEDVGEARRDEDRKPKSWSAQAACSRLEPQPKFRRARRIVAPANSRRFNSKAGLTEPSSRNRQSKKRNCPKPLRSIRLRNCFGMI